MTQFPEINAAYYARIMRDFLAGSISTGQYQRAIFDAAKVRSTLTEEESRIVGAAYRDADDYDAEIRLPYTIEELELRRRVASLLEQFRDVGANAGH